MELGGVCVQGRGGLRWPCAIAQSLLSPWGAGTGQREGSTCCGGSCKGRRAVGHPVLRGHHRDPQGISGLSLPDGTESRSSRLCLSPLAARQTGPTQPLRTPHAPSRACWKARPCSLGPHSGPPHPTLGPLPKPHRWGLRALEALRRTLVAGVGLCRPWLRPTPPRPCSALGLCLCGSWLSLSAPGCRLSFHVTLREDEAQRGQGIHSKSLRGLLARLRGKPGVLGSRLVSSDPPTLSGAHFCLGLICLPRNIQGNAQWGSG